MSVVVESGAVKAALNSLIEGIEKVPLGRVGATLQSNIKANLGRGLTPWGEPFEPLKGASRRRKGKGRVSPVPLNDTRQHIYNRITYRMIGRNAVIVGILDSANAKIGQVHQYGAVIHQPPRSQKVAYRVNFKTGRSRFSRVSKANFEQWHTFKERTIRIPARPFLPIRNGAVSLPYAWEKELRQMVLDSIKS